MPSTLRIPLAALVALAVVGAASASSTSSSMPRFAGCYAKHPQLGPRSIIVACGDGNLSLTALEWSAWNQRMARATGIGHLNDCTPNCASGHFRRYPVAVWLLRPRRCRRWTLFTRLAYSFTGQKPSGALRSGSAQFPFPNTYRCP